MINWQAVSMTNGNQPYIKVNGPADGRLSIVAGGEWSIQQSLPSVEELMQQVKALPAQSVVDLDFSAVTQWDSSLAAVLVPLAKECKSRHISCETGRLPGGLLALLKAALAVPEQPVRGDPRGEYFFSRVGRAGISLFGEIREVFAFLGVVSLAFGQMLRGKASFRWSDVWLIIQRTGAEALMIVALINFLIGLILGFVGGVQLRNFGATIFMATLVGVAMARELGCLMTGIIMSGRTGASFAAELGSMKANQEIDALRTLGISPVEFLVLPRMLAAILMMPLLTVYGNVMGMVGGAVLAPAFGVPIEQYYHQLVISVNLSNYLAGVIKAFFFGAVVAGCGCLKGMQSGKSSSDVGLSTTSAVVTSITMIIALDAVFAFILTALGI
jgi:phospholipid/cholesterol/gamma-HCH transport system permease protein